jgi:hypothetical protein
MRQRIASNQSNTYLFLHLLVCLVLLSCFAHLCCVEDKLAVEHRVREASEKEHREHFEELTLL